MSIRKVGKILVLLFLFALCSTSALASKYSEANGIILNNNKLNLDVKPIVKEGRTFVPIRAILESLGMKVSWDSIDNIVIGEKEGNVLKIYTEEKLGVDGTYNGVPFHSEDAPSIIVNNRTLVPVRTIATLLNLDVKWDQTNKNVILKEIPRSKVSLKQAYDTLVKNIESDEINQDLDFIYLPFGGYASKNDTVLDSNYVFAVYSYYEIIGDDSCILDDYNIWDVNIITDKNTGERKAYEPILGIEGTISYKVRDYLENVEYDLSNVKTLWWENEHLEALKDETVNKLHSKFLESGGNEYNIGDFAEYLSVNAPVYPKWKEVFEKSFTSLYEEKIVKYEDYGNGYVGVYIEGVEIPIVTINTITGHYSSI